MRSIVVRFPDGAKEFRYPEKMLEEDDVVWHDGKPFRVVSVRTEGDSRATVIVEPASPTFGDLLSSEEGAIRLDPLEGAQALSADREE